MGRDLVTGIPRHKARDFNPRARVGRDFPQLPLPYHLHISIHAPAWGATIAYMLVLPMQIFQSTRPRGARLYRATINNNGNNYFNPRARVGRDRKIPLVQDI